MKGAVALLLSGTACNPQTSWAMPNPDAPVTATTRGMLAVNQGLNTPSHVHCLAQKTNTGQWDIEASVSLDGDARYISVNAFVDPNVPSPGGFQLVAPTVRDDISSNNAGPCLFTLIEVSDGAAWGKVECAATHERDMTECGAATIYFAFENCFIDRALSNMNP
jgi:hypothetical protein